MAPALGFAYAWSVLDTTTRSRCPTGTWWATAGSATSTDVTPSGVSPTRCTGATTDCGSTAVWGVPACSPGADPAPDPRVGLTGVVSGPRSHNDTNRVALVVDEVTSSRIRPLPSSVCGVSSTGEVKTADWPGSTASGYAAAAAAPAAASEPPGRLVMAVGTPPGGDTTCCCAPSSRWVTCSTAPPVRPG